MNVSQETMQLVRESLSKANPPAILEVLQKAGWTQSATATSGITYYSLEAPSKHLVPFLSPLRNEIPRETGGAGIQAAWRAITAINSTNVTIGVAEGKRGGEVTPTTADYLAKFVTLGLETSVTDEAYRAAKNFEDLRATAQTMTLQQFMVEEERIILGGVGTTALATAAAPTGTLVADSTQTGTMTEQATFCYVVALTLEGLRQAGGPINPAISTTAVATTASRTRTGPYGGTDTVNLGTGIVSAASSSKTTDATHHAVDWAVASVPGAVAYAWFAGPTNAAGAKLFAITTVNAVRQLADGASTQAANFTGNGTDHTKDALVFDGILAQAAKSGSNAYIKSLDNAAWTESGDGTITEFETALQSMYDNYRIGIDDFWMNSGDHYRFKKHILSKSGSPTWRLNVNAGGSIEMIGGSNIVKYENPYTGQIINIKTHPYLPQGTAFGYAKSLPYLGSNVPATFKMDMRIDYYTEEWPRNQRSYEFGIYEDGLLKGYFPPGTMVFQNIGAS